MMLRNGAHIDHVLDINPKATLAIAQHNSSSPLLKLPLEVKNIIYKLTFGGNLIHITQNPDDGATKFKNTVCRALISEVEAQENFDNEIMHQWYVPANEGRHKCCRLQKGVKRPQILRLSALRSCRQVYNEAHHIPYSTNTFSCADPKVFQSFVESLTQGSNDNHLAVRSFFIEIVFSRSATRHSIWRKGFTTGAKYLKNLQSIDISFEWGQWELTSDTSSFAQSDEKGRKQYFPTSDILVLKKLPLKSANIVISDALAFKNVNTPYLLGIVAIDKRRWKLTEKQEWVRYVKELILK